MGMGVIGVWSPRGRGPPTPGITAAAKFRRRRRRTRWIQREFVRRGPRSWLRGRRPAKWRPTHRARIGRRSPAEPEFPPSVELSCVTAGTLCLKLRDTRSASRSLPSWSRLMLNRPPISDSEASTLFRSSSAGYPITDELAQQQVLGVLDGERQPRTHLLEALRGPRGPCPSTGGSSARSRSGRRRGLRPVALAQEVDRGRLPRDERQLLATEPLGAKSSATCRFVISRPFSDEEARACVGAARRDRGSLRARHALIAAPNRWRARPGASRCLKGAGGAGIRVAPRCRRPDARSATRSPRSASALLRRKRPRHGPSRRHGVRGDELGIDRFRPKAHRRVLPGAPALRPSTPARPQGAIHSRYRLTLSIFSSLIETAPSPFCLFRRARRPPNCTVATLMRTVPTRMSRPAKRRFSGSAARIPSTCSRALFACCGGGAGGVPRPRWPPRRGPRRLRGRR